MDVNPASTRPGAAPTTAVDGWTCPFCALTCDDVAAAADDAAPRLRRLDDDAPVDCARAERRLAGHAARRHAVPTLDGKAVPFDAAVAQAARWLAQARQPLFGGLGADVAATRALHPLAVATGAIVDTAGGDALTEGLRALQDRGQFTATFAEVAQRADVVVALGGLPLAQAPRLPTRLGLADADGPARVLWMLGGDRVDGLAPAVAQRGVATSGDAASTLRQLAALVAGRNVRAADAALVELAQALRAARYAVLVGAPAELGAHAALAIEAAHRVVGELNRTTRAAALWIGGGEGAATANQTLAWLSGLPLRSRVGVHGFEHEPLRFGSARLLAAGAVDTLLWLSLFDPQAAPPALDAPRIVLGPPAMAAACAAPRTVFFPVATPGLQTVGHLLRTDGTVMLPLKRHAAWAGGSALPSADAVLQALRRAVCVGAATKEAGGGA